MSADLDLDALREVAEAATQGAWEDHAQSLYPRVNGVDGSLVVIDRDADADDLCHIATFDPPTVLALINEVTRLRAENAALRAFDPCQGGEEPHDRHVTVCVPFYEARRAALGDDQ